MNRFGLSFVIHIKMKQTRSTFLKGESSILIITKMNSPETCEVTLIIQKNWDQCSSLHYNCTLEMVVV